jgi:hypothetical protein
MDMESTKEVAGRIKATGIVSKFSKVTSPEILEKYDYMDTVSGVFYKADEIEFQEPKDTKEFYGQVCQDPYTTKMFRELHTELVNRVIEWCNENNVQIDEFHLHADGIRESIPYASWQPCTDSGLEMYRREELDKEDPEPYLFSM